MPQQPQYLSTDPNAGDPVYLSTDPNAGEAPDQESSGISRALMWATSSIIPGLTGSVRGRDEAAGFWDPDIPLSQRLVEGATSPVGLAGEALGVLGILRGLRGARPAVAAAAHGVPGGNLVRGGQVVRATAGPSAAVPGAADEFADALGSVLARLRAEGRPVRISAPPGPAQPAVSYPSIRPSRRTLPAAVPEPSTTLPGAGFAEPPLSALPEAVAARATKPRISAQEVAEFLRQREGGAARGRSFQEISEELGQLTREVSTNASMSDEAFAAAAARMKVLREEQATRFPAEMAARQAALDRSTKAATLESYAGGPRGQVGGVVFDERLASRTSGPPAAGRMTLPETRVPDRIYEADRARLGIAPSPLEEAEKAAVMRGRSSLAAKLPEGATVPAEEQQLLDHLGAAYRDADNRLAVAERAFFKSEITSEALGEAKIARREAGKALRQNELRIIKNAQEAAKRGINSEAGFIAPQLAQALAGGVIGGTTGAALDPEDPWRGAAIGAVTGAFAPGTTKGVIKNIQKEGLLKTLGPGGRAHISGMLTGPATIGLNITSTAANGLLRAATHPAAVLLDIGRVAVKGGPRTVRLGELTPATIATWTGFKRGATDALRALSTGRSPYRELFQGGPSTATEMPGGLGNIFNWPGRILDASDTWMARIVEAQEIAARAYTDGVNRGLKGNALWEYVGRMQAHPSEALQSIANAEARRVLFRGDAGVLTNLASHARDRLNAMPGLLGRVPFGSALMPFVRVPAMVAREMTDLSPLGVLKQLPGVSPRVGALPARDRLLHGTRALAGSLLMWKGAELAVEGRIAGSGPSNPSARAKLYETGWRPYSVNVPGNLPKPLAAALKATRADDGSYWIPANSLGPIGSLLVTSADLIQGWQESGERDDATMERQVMEAAARVASSITDQTFLTDSIELAEAIDTPSRLPNYLQRKAASMVPAGVAFVQRQMDPTVRQPQSATEAIKARIPGLSETVPAKIGRFGEELQRGTLTAPPPQHAARGVLEGAGAKLGISSGRITVSPTTEEGQRLRRALESAGFEFDDNNVIKLTPSERRALQQKRGKEIADTLALLRNSQTYRALPPDAQKILIERLKGRIENDRRMPELLDLVQRRAAGRQ